MEQLRYVIIQLEEAKRYIETKSVPYLRLALLLLDNAAEIQMYRTIEHELVYNDWYQKMQDTILQTMKEHPSSGDDLPPMLQGIVHMKLLSAKDKKRLSKYFDEKLKYLGHELPHLHISRQYETELQIDTTPYLDESVAEVLSHLHHYRNEAYHRTKVRPETLLTAALILFEINCDFFLSLSKHVGVTYSSADDYSWLDERCISKPFLNNDYREKIISVLKANLPINDETISRTLADHLASRLLDLDGSLEFIKDNVGSDNAPDLETALRYSQFYVASKDNKQRADIEGFKKFKAEQTYNGLERIKVDIPLIHKAVSRIETFKVLANLEKKLEKIEPSVFQLERDIDEYIQLQIDIARGK